MTAQKTDQIYAMRWARSMFALSDACDDNRMQLALILLDVRVHYTDLSLCIAMALPETGIH